MSGAGAVVALVLLEWTTGWLAVAAWTQSWAVIRRGHFRITAWATLILGGLAAAAYRSVEVGDLQSRAVLGFVVAVALYVAVQYSRTDLPGAVMGAVAGICGGLALILSAELIPAWPQPLAAMQLLAGAALLGAVSNGMMLGHWYLNQPGLKTWALARLTLLGVVATGASGAVGLLGAARLSGASTAGAAFGLPGAGDSFGRAFFLVWTFLLAFTGVVVWAARRCVAIRSIQSATGLYYVAILTAGVSEFVVRYLMVNAA
ncbi:MAG: hypothetical protein M3360_00515 [Actinomycetota bacterium]|nr:hypothetical protein [Actinomycetota bacterium]